MTIVSVLQAPILGQRPTSEFSIRWSDYFTGTTLGARNQLRRTTAVINTNKTPLNLLITFSPPPRAYAHLVELATGTSYSDVSIWDKDLTRGCRAFIDGVLSDLNNVKAIGTITLDFSPLFHQPLMEKSASGWQLRIGDPAAKEDFGYWALKKYGGGGPLRDAWGEKVQGPKSAIPFTFENRFNDRSWVDLWQWAEHSSSEYIYAVAKPIRDKYVDVPLQIIIPDSLISAKNPTISHLVAIMNYLHAVPIKPNGVNYDAIAVARLSTMQARSKSTIRKELQFGEIQADTAVMMPAADLVLNDQNAIAEVEAIAKEMHCSIIEEAQINSYNLEKLKRLIVPTISRIETQAWENVQRVSDSDLMVYIHYKNEGFKSVEGYIDYKLRPSSNNNIRLLPETTSIHQFIHEAGKR